MSFEFAVFIAFLLIVGSATFLMLKYERAKMARREDDLRREASGRGWRYQALRESHGYIQRWHGTTDFVTWTVEFESPPNRKQSPRLRWWTETMRGPSAPVLLMAAPAGISLPSLMTAKDGGLLSTLVQKAAGFAMDKAVDVFFGTEVGKQVDATALKPVETVTIPGFIVMAGNPNEAWQTLSSGLQQAVAQFAHDQQIEALGKHSRPSILVLPRQLMIGRQAAKVSTPDIEHLIRAGVALTRSTRVG